MTHLFPEPIRDPFAARGKLTPPGAEAIVRVTSLEKYFGTNHVLRGVTLEVYPRETICIIGRSGSGKSTLLRCMNFLEEPTVGTVELANIRVQASPLETRTRRHREEIRQIRLQAQMVFQEFNLFPHMTVLENVIEGPVRVKKVPRDQAVATAEKYLDKVGLYTSATVPSPAVGRPEAAGSHRPGAHDGAEGAAVRRAHLGARPDLVGEVLHVMAELAREGSTMIVVTHEMAFAREAADRVYFIEEGVFLEAGPPEQVIEAPRDERSGRSCRGFSSHQPFRSLPFALAAPLKQERSAFKVLPTRRGKAVG